VKIAQKHQAQEKSIKTAAWVTFANNAYALNPFLYFIDQNDFPKIIPMHILSNSYLYFKVMVSLSCPNKPLK